MRWTVLAKMERVGYASAKAPRTYGVTLQLDELGGELVMLVDRATWDQLSIGDEVDVLVVPSKAKLRAVPPPPATEPAT